MSNTTVITNVFTIEKEFVHSAGLIEFFYFIFALLAFVVAVVKKFVMKGPVVIIQSNDAQAQQNPPSRDTAQKQGSSEDKYKMSEDKEKKEIEIKIDDEDKSGEDSKEGEKENSDENSSQQSKKSEPQQKNVQPEKKIEAVYQKEIPIILKIDSIVTPFFDRYFISWIILEYLIAGWGTYIYAAIFTFFTFFSILLFNHLNLAVNQPATHFISHICILTLFISYLIVSQKFSNTIVGASDYSAAATL